MPSDGKQFVKKPGLQAATQSPVADSTEMQAALRARREALARMPQRSDVIRTYRELHFFFVPPSKGKAKSRSRPDQTRQEFQ
jgi:hypothetical protein